MACNEQKHMFGGNTIGLYKAVRLRPMNMVRRKTGIAYNQRFEHNVSKLYDVLSKQIVLWGMPHFELIMTCLGFGDVRWDVLSLEEECDNRRRSNFHFVAIHHSIYLMHPKTHSFI